jgi:AIPR protein
MTCGPPPLCTTANESASSGAVFDGCAMIILPPRMDLSMNTALQVINEIIADRKHKTSPDMEDDDFFELFSAEQVLRHMRLIPSSIDDGIIGKGGKGDDGGIDAAYLFVNGRLLSGDLAPEDLEHYKKNVVLDWVIVQAKRQTSFKEDVFPKIQQTLADIFDLQQDAKTLRKSYNAAIVEMAERFRVARRYLQAVGAEINTHIFYACKGDTAQIHPKIDTQKQRLEKAVVTAIPGSSTCKATPMGARELADLAAKAPQTKRPLLCADLFIVSGGYICLASLDQYFAFISEKGELLRYLFESNVRDYLEDVDVNNDIRESLRTPSGEDFWMLNNGITVLAENVIPTQEKTLMIDDPQIVNGLQTSEEIFNYCSGHPNPQHLQRRVMVRVITSTSSDSQDRIIKATNRQTGITAAQLHATEQVHRDIERIFPGNGLYYDRRKKYWQYKDKPKDQIVSIQDLSQALIAIFEQRPDTARARPGDAFSKKKKELYDRLYDPQNPLDFYVSCALIQKMMEAGLRAAKVPRGTANDLRFYGSMALSVLVTKKIKPTATELAGIDRKKIDLKVMGRAAQLANEAYAKHGADEDAAKGSKMLATLNELLDKEMGVSYAAGNKTTSS